MKLTLVVRDSEKTVSEESSAPTQPLSKPIPAKKRMKITIHLKKTTVISDLLTTLAIYDSDNTSLLQVFKPTAIPTPKL